MKSTFTALDLKPLDEYVEDRRVYLLLRDLHFRSENYGNITVPRGFKTDLASVPRALTWLFPTDGRYMEAAIVHDYLYAFGIGTKRDADAIFKYAMKQLGVQAWRRWCLYWAVRFFGKGAFDGRNPKRNPGYIKQTYLDEKGQPLSYVSSILKAEGFEDQ